MTAEVPRARLAPAEALVNDAATRYLATHLFPTLTALTERAEETKRWCEERSAAAAAAAAGG